MFIKGEALEGTITVSFTISGKRGEWRVSITAPGGIVTEDETVEASWDQLFKELLRIRSPRVRTADDFCPSAREAVR